jgi:hypothetical protein
MSMSDPFGDLSTVANTETGTNHLPDLRIFPQQYSGEKLFTRCQAVIQPLAAIQKRCRYYRKSSGDSHRMEGARCMYQKYPSMAVCDKVTDSDGRSIN